MKQKLIYSTGFMIIGLIAGFFVITMQVANLPDEMLEEITSELGQIEILYIVGAIQIGILSFILSFTGQLMLSKTGFILFPELQRKNIILACSIGALGAVAIVVLDSFIFKEIMSSINTPYEFSFTYFISSVLYGGIIEEVIMRLFLLTFLVLFFNIISDKNKKRNTYIAIILTSILFGIGHLSAMAVLTELTSGIIIRTIFINMIPALGYGYLYTNKGFSYSVIAHIFTHIALQLVLGPLFL